MVTALRSRYKLCEILPAVGMAKSSYEYAMNARDEGEGECLWSNKRVRRHHQI